MGKGRIRLTRTVPGPRNLAAIVRTFGRREGVVTAFSDPQLSAIARLVEGDPKIEAVPFGSLVRRYAALCGELPRPIAQSAHVVAAIAAACEDLPADSPFLKTAHHGGLHRALAETLHELAEHGLDPDRYAELAEAAEFDLAAKLRSMAFVEREASESLRQLGRAFGRESMRALLEEAPEKGAELGRVLVIAGGEVHPQACELLRWASKNGASVQVVTFRHATDGQLFQGARQTEALLGGEVEEVGDAADMLRQLFSPHPQPASKPTCAVESAADPLAEAEWALRGCLERHAAGQDYESMSLYVRDLAGYAPLVEASARRLDVPVQMNRRAPLLTNSFARLTLGTLEFAASSDVRSLRPLAATSYFRLGFEVRRELTAALAQAHLEKRAQWTALSQWVAEHPDFGWLRSILEWRNEALSGSQPLEGWIARLRDLIACLPLSDIAAQIERDKRAQFVLQQSLNSVAAVRRLQDRPASSLAEFVRIAKRTWEEADVSIPSGSQGVRVVGRAEALPASRALFVLGMVEGVFPRRRSEDPILTDEDRAWIGEQVGRKLPDSRSKAESERDDFYCVCACADDEIVLSYPESDEEKDNVPAFYLDEVRALFGMPEVRAHPRQLLAPDLEDGIALSDLEMARALALPDRTVPKPVGFDLAETAQDFLPAPDRFSPQELSEALQCPFAYFVRRRLDLRVERRRARWYSLTTLPVAGSLESAADEADATSRLNQALDQKMDSLYAEAQPWEIALLRAGGKRMIREWVHREFAARRIWPQDRPSGPVRFGEPGLRDEVMKRLILKGEVAGLSHLGPYTVVHLVESSIPSPPQGSHAHELPDQDMLYYGLHLLAAWDRGVAALEIESMGAERMLVVLPRLPEAQLRAEAANGLKLLDLAGGEGAAGCRRFFEQVKELTRESLDRVRTVQVEPIRGEHCGVCDYGELCRRSAYFGEEESPFEGL